MITPRKLVFPAVALGLRPWTVSPAGQGAAGVVPESGSVALEEEFRAPGDEWGPAGEAP